MKECNECKRKLGIIEGYRHPTMGKEYLLCSSCYDTVTLSVKKWSEFISPYIGFFNKESFTNDDNQNIKVNISKNKQNRINNLWSYKNNQKANENLSIINIDL